MSNLVLFDVPGPRTRRRMLLVNVLAGVVVAGIAVWALVLLGRKGQLAPAMWEPFVQPRTWTAYLLPGLLQTLRAAGYVPYYLYRQKYMSGSFENVGWTKPGHDNLYNICMMEELHTVISCGGAGSTKVITADGKLVRQTNPKYPKEYITNINKILDDKKKINLKG